ncbi:hypothetical protein NEAUS04_0942 [Nematocida ausubeli]|uniref:DBF4-type domain-containing protein n=1 Tax=Nematocida ausubeli (strain ATCC PRA-371 / ERTm2) TaxID=1913371 RepID=H8ZFN8_NEMA1|nr:uncharacterized protein NESG_00458 [Nematocida ausubeli]EHY64599.1 hypothetical protein NERG_02409 [Nematocida ausubeli]KAI5135588.1 hypothetical protein NEAUS07_1237 [Nematocida ausubeli]KAI5136147.1 hypothetical protein NEAUS06_1771 [Nematocida ausubeli]KAI5148536.1 hypothetical protein NEAUS05_1418 [Nematocida ausubeli]KAI5162214.1 hypothetical protein NEAUS04_0942 [Nematocida ausubeli]
MEYFVFNSPYILIEDIKGKNKPFYKEYKKEKEKNKNKRTGLCELCVAGYENYNEHISAEKHKKIEEKINYEEIDIIIERYKKREKRMSKKRLFI